MTEPIRIDVWSDIACPWCFVGKRHLELALAELGAEAQIVWHAFELDPDASPAPAEPVPYVERLAAKYGCSTEEARGMIDRMAATGAEVGLELRFDRVVPTNTFDAHRLLAWAKSRGKQAELKERLLTAYMTEGLDLGDPEVLARLAGDVGLDAKAASGVLEREDFDHAVRQDEAAAHQLGVRGVPFFVVGGRFALSGAQPPAVIADAIRQALAPSPELSET